MQYIIDDLSKELAAKDENGHILDSQAVSQKSTELDCEHKEVNIRYKITDGCLGVLGKKNGKEIYCRCII